MITEQDFIPDTYRTIATIPDRGRCWECKHARYRMKDGHISTHVTKEKIAEIDVFARCVVGEHESTSLCAVTGVRSHPEKMRGHCRDKNPGGECTLFERSTTADLVPANLWLRIPPRLRTFESIAIAVGVGIVALMVAGSTL